jgi:putative peptide maturation dehydrogenase
MAAQWNGYAALFHYMTRWTGVTFDESGESASTLKSRSRTAAGALVEIHGLPPGEFAEFGSGPVVELPRIDRHGEFYSALLGRRTTRSFDPSTPMTLEQLDTVVRYVFGCHGYGRNSADALCIKRTSPSGGGLAPIEAYLIADGVQSVPSGIYHYNGRDHSLVQMEELHPGEGRDLATEFMCGQWYFGTAHVTFILTARFYRNHWKYRRHPKAYSTILMDAAHLTQTLYLVCAHERLGAFVTIAINDRDIEQRLGLDGINEGVIAMAGCGPAGADLSPLDMRFEPATPDGT